MDITHFRVNITLMGKHMQINFEYCLFFLFQIRDLNQISQLSALEYIYLARLAFENLLRDF